MGGHGALVCALRNPEQYSSVSAFAPICHPSECPWGVRAFTGYLGDDKHGWRDYDAVELIIAGHKFASTVLVDQGDSDKFLASGQLLPDHLEDACRTNNVPLTLRMQKGYDHSYYFISTFIEAHLEFHHRHLCDGASGE